MSIKEQAISSVIWTSAGRIFNLGFEFIVGISLARILTPDDFGLVGMVTIFLVLSETLINSGFSQALIRKPVCTEEDFSTAFIFNLLASLFIATLMYFFSPYISKFYDKPILTGVIQLLGFGLCINAVSFVQKTNLTRKLDFEMLTKISILSSIVSGLLSIVLALNGFGVWSLVVKTLMRDGTSSALLWLNSKWKPVFKFYKSSFSELFQFGSRLVLSGILGILTNNMVYVILGKFYHVSNVGYYNRAELFKNLPSQNIENIISTVGYPILAKLQNQPEAFKNYFKRMVLVTGFIVAVLMCGLFSVAQPVIVILLGDEWITAAEYLKYLCPVGLIYPLWTINLNIFNIVGRSDLYLKLQLFMQLFTLISVMFAIFLSIQWMIVFLAITSLVSFILFAFFSQRFTNYSLLCQLKDLMPGLIISLSMGGLVYIIGAISGASIVTTLFLQVFSGFFYLIIVCELIEFREYIFIKSVLLDRIKKII